MQHELAELDDNDNLIVSDDINEETETDLSSVYYSFVGVIDDIKFDFDGTKLLLAARAVPIGFDNWNISRVYAHQNIHFVTTKKNDKG
jgi:hypothetical protein